MCCCRGEQLVGSALDGDKIDARHGGDGNTATDPTPDRGTVRTMDVGAALGTYLDIADSVAPGLVEGLYVVGSYALGDWMERTSDIDIVAVTAEPATDEGYGSLRTVHALLAEHQPLPHIDGPYVAWGDLVVEPATGLHRPWTLNGELHHDGDCFEINPVTWHTLAAHGVTVRGPMVASLGIPTDTEARIRFVVDNLQGYWRDVADGVATACARPQPPPFTAADLVWCALGPLRLHYTAFTGDVTSKRGAGEYGLREAPPHLHGVLHAALAARANGELGPASTDDMRATAALTRWCIAEVETAV